VGCSDRTGTSVDEEGGIWEGGCEGRIWLLYVEQTRYSLLVWTNQHRDPPRPRPTTLSRPHAYPHLHSDIVHLTPSTQDRHGSGFDTDTAVEPAAHNIPRFQQRQYLSLNRYSTLQFLLARLSLMSVATSPSLCHLRKPLDLS
jgi:hypothetical protein